MSRVTANRPISVRLAVIAAAGVCLLVTSAGPIRADDARSRRGMTLRGGSVAGKTQLRGEDVTTVGVQLGLGYQLGRLAVELEHERAALLEKNAGTRRGGASRSAVNVRLYALNLHRFRSRSVLRLYLEAGAGRNAGDFSTGARFSRLDSSAGAGVLLDHRALMADHGGVRFAGWHLGWSLRGSEVAAMSPSYAASCKGEPCAPPEPVDRDLDLSLMVSSSLSFNW